MVRKYKKALSLLGLESQSRERASFGAKPKPKGMEQ